MDKHTINWLDKYSVGIDIIDTQHRNLIQMANELFEGCNLGTQEAKAYFIKTIHKSVVYVKEHLATEEEILKHINYPDYHIHKKEHEDFAKNILYQVKAFEDGEDFVPNNFARYLQSWVINHIAISDHKYAEYIKSIRTQDNSPPLKHF